MGGQSGDRSRVWRADLISGTGESIELPQPKHGLFTRWVADQLSPSAAISPDSEVFIVSRSFTPFDILDRPRDGGGELDLIQSKPLKFLGAIPSKTGCESSGALGVDHKDGLAIVLLRRCGEWERVPYPIPRR